MKRILAASLVLLVACGHQVARERSLIPKKALELGERKLDLSESALLSRQGVAISQDTANSFHVGYVGLFHAHQPVYITADSLLHAWHSSYDAILMELEHDALIPSLTKMLAGLREELSKHASDPSAADVDLYLSVAYSLLTGIPLAPVAGADQAKAAELLAQCETAEGAGEIELFGAHDKFDFSMLKPRGHYTRSIELQRYFRSMSFLGRVELRLASRPDPEKPWIVNRRVVAGSAFLNSLFTPAWKKEWTAIDATIASFVGPPDSMSLPGLTKGLGKLDSVTNASDEGVVAAFEGVAQQRINTQLVHRGEKNIAFVLLGQRFVYDSQVLGHLVYGSLATKRMMPTPLDVAHSVLHHPQARELLEPEVKRFGSEYEKALETEWKATDSEDPSLWTGSLYHGWLNALRELSPDAKRDQNLPAPLNSKAWGLRMLNGQLASWAELRHDNLLYAKQSVTAMAMCEFPSAYVDPYPGFFKAMEQLAVRTSSTIDSLQYETPRKAHLLTWLTQMRATMVRLGKMAERERANQPLTADDLDFINHMVSIDGKSAGCTTVLEAQGWFADLFWNRDDALWHRPVIADVHTQPTDEIGNMVGRVLHVGTARPRMMVVTLQHDGGKNTQTYRGFVSTYAEFQTSDFKRLTDEDWGAQVYEKSPPAPEWLQPILAP